MERLERKKIKGQYYYYYSHWAKVDGKCRRLWQLYLGKLEDIVLAVKGGRTSPAFAEVFNRGLSLSLWNVVQSTKIIETIDQQCPKRNQGHTIGEYIAIAAINRASDPVSKRSIYEWFSETVLRRLIPNGSNESLSSQRFWDHMDRIKDQDIPKIWNNIMQEVLKQEEIDLNTIQLDNTNFYTFIDTFNERCEIAKYGKNKQKRNDLRQINYSLFCSAEHELPLFFDTYEGNINDYTQFPLVLNKFYDFVKKISSKGLLPNITAVFDKGNNSAKNIEMVDKMNLHYVSSIRPTEASDLSLIPKNSKKFTPCLGENLEGTHVYRTRQKIMGKMRTAVLTFSEALFEREFKTASRNITDAMDELEAYKNLLDDRRNGVITKGKHPTLKSVQKKCEGILTKPYLKESINIIIKNEPGTAPKLTYSFDEDSFNHYAKTALGKNILITNRDEWSSEKIIEAYRSLHGVEEVFKQMKDRRNGSWWPMYHWTDSKIKVHGLYCALAILLRAIISRKVKKSGIEISKARLLTELDKVKEIINVIPKEKNQKSDRTQTVLSKLSPLQEKLVNILQLGLTDSERLGDT